MCQPLWGGLIIEHDSVHIEKLQPAAYCILLQGLLAAYRKKENGDKCI